MPTRARDPSLKTEVPTMSRSEHPFAPFIRTLGKGRQGSRALDEQDAYDAMSMILRDEIAPEQLGAFLMLMRVKEETPDEVAGFVRAVRDTLPIPQIDAPVALDWSSYAGKRRQLPWFILSVLALSASGIRVFMHGASGHTAHRIYTSDALTALGIAPATSIEHAVQQLNERDFSYLDLQHLCPVLHRIMALKPLLGLRSPVHTVARMLNPFAAPHMMQGIFHPGYLAIHQQAGVKLNQPHLAVIKGEGGEIEVNPDTPSKVFYAHAGVPNEDEWPPMFSRRHVKPEQLDIQLLASVWRGEASHEYGEAAVISTLALTLHMMNKARDKNSAMDMARALWADRPRDWIA